MLSKENPNILILRFDYCYIIIQNFYFNRDKYSLKFADEKKCYVACPVVLVLKYFFYILEHEVFAVLHEHP